MKFCPETFAVQFAVLLRAHATSLKLLAARLEKALSAETRKLGDLVIAHQNSIQRMAALLDQETGKNGEGERTVDFFSEIKKEIQAGLIVEFFDSQIRNTEPHFCCRHTSAGPAQERSPQDRHFPYPQLHGWRIQRVGISTSDSLIYRGRL